MTSSTTSESTQFYQDSQIWDNLKQAIATSSGFQRWQLEHQVGEQLQEYNLDIRVRRYLRETLETLAY
ncbi:MAG: hypothetical protein M3O33_14555 [Cyanobacteriota bacterium]|nr:hypothetical protein [Cyanobacteriota bacterium]